MKRAYFTCYNNARPLVQWLWEQTKLGKLDYQGHILSRDGYKVEWWSR